MPELSGDLHDQGAGDAIRLGGGRSGDQSEQRIRAEFLLCDEPGNNSHSLILSHMRPTGNKHGRPEALTEEEGPVLSWSGST